MISSKNVPTDPGVYQFIDAYGSIIYIGKAKNLRKRVSSYFRKANHSAKTQLLVRNIVDAKFIIVENEVEALLLENKLIKKHKPKYNINLKDAKTFAYIHITDEDFPRIRSTRRVEKRGYVFGPYTDGTARRELVSLCVELFKLRVCRKLPKRACLNYHINLCSAPCIMNVSKEKYAQQVADAVEFLKGKTSKIERRLKKEMKDASTSRKYEVALERKRQLDAISHLNEKQTVDLVKKFNQDVIGMTHDTERAVITLFSVNKGVISGKKEFRFAYDTDLLEEFITMYYSKHVPPYEVIIPRAFWEDEDEKKSIELYLAKQRGGVVHLVVPLRGEKKSLLKIAEKNAAYGLENKILAEIQQKLNLPKLPRVIECFDMSNLGADYFVGGMTRWVEGLPDKEGYRKFEIKDDRKVQDDFASMREVVYRRYKRLAEEGRELPDLIIVDGGKGQLSSAVSSLERVGLRIPIIGLAKREEEIFLPHESEPRKFAKNSEMMLLIRRIRDSVHRFVLAYNRKKREMRLREQAREE